MLQVAATSARPSALSRPQAGRPKPPPTALAGKKPRPQPDGDSAKPTRTCSTQPRDAAPAKPARWQKSPHCVHPSPNSTRNHRRPRRPAPTARPGFRGTTRPGECHKHAARPRAATRSFYQYIPFEVPLAITYFMVCSFRSVSIHSSSSTDEDNNPPPA